LALYDALQLLGQSLLVRPLAGVEMTKGGLYIPDAARDNTSRGIVEKVGPGELKDIPVPPPAADSYLAKLGYPGSPTPTLAFGHRPMPFKPGDLVFYQKYGGFVVPLEGHDRLMLMEDEVKAYVPASAFTLITHGNNGEQDHLEGEPCQQCQAPAEADAKARLAAERLKLVSSDPAV
jgi:co-chaperonin GroES (HSP10)